MARIEIRKYGRIVTQREIDDDKARGGVHVRLGDAGRVKVSVGKPASVGEYYARIIMDDAPGGGVVGRRGSDRDEALAALSIGETPGGDRLPNVQGYRITGRLGEGGMGVVWRAEQLGTKRQVALKLLSIGRFGSPRARARFKREVQLAARLDHPGIARVYDSGVHQRAYYYAMEYVEGVDLDRYVQDKRLSQQQVLKLMQEVCAAVQHAHQRGVIHRDLKPSNILVDAHGSPHVLDFGLARTMLDEDKGMTISIDGEVAGTPAYMAPEQAAGRHGEMDARTDVYTLGVILYRLLTGGQWPHDVSGSKYDIFRRIIEQDIRRPRDANDAIDPELEAILLKALSRDRANRYATAGELGEDINSYLRGQQLTAKKRTALYFARKRLKRIGIRIAVVAAVLAVVAALGIAYRLFFEPSPSARAVTGVDEAEIVERERQRADALVKREQARAFEPMWKAIQLLDRGQGFGRRLDECVRLRRLADARFNEEAYASASATYDRWRDECKAIEMMEVLRASSIIARGKITQAKALARQARAPDKVSSLWNRAETLSKQAGECFGRGQFADAKTKWESARQEYARAEKQAPLVSADQTRALTAKQAAEQAGALAEAAGGKQMAPTAWKKVDDLDIQALAAFDGGKYADAARLWTKAAEEYEEFAQGARRVTAARKAFSNERAKCDETMLLVQAPAQWQQVLAAVRIAESSAQGGDFDGAVRTYQRAMGLIGGAVTTAEARRNAALAKKNREGFEKALSDVEGLVRTLPEKVVLKPHRETAHRALAMLSDALKIQPKAPRPGASGDAPSDADRVRALRRRIEERIHTIVLELGGGVEMKLVLIRAGQVVVPSTGGDDRTIRIPESFYMGVTEVTQEQYHAITNTNPSRFKGAKRPVDNVSYLDAMTYCRLLRDKTGRSACLPTDDEWEYACRAGATTRYSFGADAADLGKFAWYRDNSIAKGPGGLRPVVRHVAQKQPNAWGMYDMHGNVAELCIGCQGGPDVTTRGGSWELGARSCEVTVVGERRRSSDSDKGTGFRVVSPLGTIADTTRLGLSLDLGSGVRMDLVSIPAGQFTMGSPATDADRDEDEGPQRKVTITKSFYMGMMEVTQAQWTAVMGTHPWKDKLFAKISNDHAANYITWEDAANFCEAISKKTGRLVRLPTEAEWEYACRAGTTTRFYYGDDPGYRTLAAHAWCVRNTWAADEKYPRTVGVKRANRWGLYDMHGNVFEWCSDRYASSYPSGDARDPKGPIGGTTCVLRGGAWGYPLEYCRTAARQDFAPTDHSELCGFRVVVEISPGAARPAPVRPKPVTIMPDTAKHLSLDLTTTVTMKLVRIEAGEFTMGSPKGETGRNADEGPQRQVMITKPFYMGATEVTQGQWKAVMDTQPWKGQPLAKAWVDNAANYISWDDAMAFCAALSRKTGRRVRLPTEAEWEYACRAGTTTAYSFGNDSSKLGDYAWYEGSAHNDDEKYAHPIGMKKPNALGLYDMHGNIWEWCADWYAGSYADAKTRDP